MNKQLLTLLFAFLFVGVQAQQKKMIELDQLTDRTFSQKSVYGLNWMNNGQFYSSLKGGLIIKYDITTGEPVDTLLDASKLSTPLSISTYSFSADENKLLIQTDRESIYRRSFKANYYVYDRSTNSLSSLSENGKQSYATFSPDGSKVAFVRDNNLFYVDLTNGTEVKVTTDGKWNEIINGSTDWVYEEEFGFAQAFFWSPDGKKIAYYRFDESEVKEYNMQKWGELYPKDYKFKYPKAGEDNAKVAILIYDLEKKKIIDADLGKETDQYIARLYWAGNTGKVLAIRLNRLQNHMDALMIDTESGASSVLFTDDSDSYVDVEFTDELIFLENDKGLLRTSEKSGYKHIYHYSMAGKELSQVTTGDWEVSNLIGYDEKKKLIYYTSTEISPMQRTLYSIRLDGKKKHKLSEKEGTNTINMSPDFKYYVNYYSSVNTPLTVSLFAAPEGKLLKTLEDNQALRDTLSNYALAQHEFIKVKAGDGSMLNGYMLKPYNFDPSKEYPVYMFVYGGPGSQTVTNSFGGGHYFYHQLLTEQGYIVVSVDNRGTGSRGKKFKHSTYAQLGKYEIEDQISAAKQLGELPYVDAARIGIWGWSYGGYMSSLGITKGADVFKMAVAVAPVSNWRYYDTIYTERYMKKPQDNGAGYDDNSPVSHMDKLKGKYLLIHGTGDDNVHFQNAVAIEEALIDANKQFTSFYYPNRNHGIYGGTTREHLYQMMYQFVLDNL